MLHPDLAVLLSTSGTTGAAKLVRLSRDNLQSNAAAIAEYLGVTADDRAITTLPFHYSYGMSVVNVQMLARAPLVLTTASVVDDAFWKTARCHGVTSLALVPTQFEMLEAEGWDRSWMPRLRYMTQAGGRLDPLLARRLADRAADEGWQLFLMYGQTEAGPRMAYVPPEDARAWSHSIGRAIPGGSFRLVDAHHQDITGTGVAGELVFRGPGVMQGYALDRDDLGTPAGPAELATGDIAERLPNGYFRITGRASRFLKLFGLRLGLDEIETALRQDGQRVFASGSDTAGLVLFLQDASEADATSLANAVAARYRLPVASVRGLSLDAPPLLVSGKVDYRQLARMAEALPPPARQDAGLEDLLATALRQSSPDPQRSFLELGGDSLAYLSVQLYLSGRLGEAPEGWEHMPVGRLIALDEGPPNPVPHKPWQPVPADLVARVLALMAVIALHATAWPTSGGAYLLLVLTGVSLARFQAAPLVRGEIGTVLQTMLLPIVSCYLLLISAMALLWKPVDPLWFVLLGNFDTGVTFKGLVPYWFVSVYAQIILLATLPFALPPVRRAMATAPFATALTGLVGAVLLGQAIGIAGPPVPVRHHHPVAALELLLLGAALILATTRQHRWIMTLALPLAWAVHWRDASLTTTAMVMGGALATLWGLRLPMPVAAARALMRVGSLTLFIYLAHAPVISMSFKALPGLPDMPRYLLVLTASLIAAVALKSGHDRTSRHLVTLTARPREPLAAERRGLL